MPESDASSERHFPHSDATAGSVADIQVTPPFTAPSTDSELSGSAVAVHESGGAKPVS